MDNISKEQQLDAEKGTVKVEEYGENDAASTISNKDGSPLETGGPKENVDHDAEERLRAAHLVPLNENDHFTPQDFSTTLKRIDLLLMPFMCLAVLLQFLDKTRYVPWTWRICLY